MGEGGGRAALHGIMFWGGSRCRVSVHVIDIVSCPAGPALRCADRFANCSLPVFSSRPVLSLHVYTTLTDAPCCVPPTRPTKRRNSSLLLRVCAPPPPPPSARLTSPREVAVEGDRAFVQLGRQELEERVRSLEASMEKERARQAQALLKSIAERDVLKSQVARFR